MRSEIDSKSPSFTVSPAPANSSRMRPDAGARISCSIFMASRMSTTSPSRTVSPGATSHCTIWAVRGERISVIRALSDSLWPQRVKPETIGAWTTPP